MIQVDSRNVTANKAAEVTATDIVTPVNTDVVTKTPKSKKRYYNKPKTVVNKPKEVEQVIVVDKKKDANKFISKIKSTYYKFISLFKRK